MRLVVGLGNPGKDYINTRHNIGFMVLENLISEEFSLNKKFNAYQYITNIGNEKIIFIKPLTYMNSSGDSVIKYVDYYKIQLEDILVIQDDMDMDVGKIKLLFNHGDGGHNGIKSIINALSSKKFLRLKIGISSPSNKEFIDYVLGKFSKDEINKLNCSFKLLNDFIHDYIYLDRDLLMGKYNSKFFGEKNENF